MIKYLLVLSILFNNFAFASNCEESVQLIEKGQVANCTGFLFSPEAEQQVAENESDLKYFKELNLKLERRQELSDKQINILEQRVFNYVEQTQILSEQIQRKERQSELQKYIWFALGIVVTSVAIHGVSKLERN